jgi:hypothetical protein
MPGSAPAGSGSTSGDGAGDGSAARGPAAPAAPPRPAEEAAASTSYGRFDLSVTPALRQLLSDSAGDAGLPQVRLAEWSRFAVPAGAGGPLHHQECWLTVQPSPLDNRHSQ